MNADGQFLQGSQIVEFDGTAVCADRSVRFFRFFGRQYAKDINGELGTLVGARGTPITFETFSEIPAGLTASGFVRGSREIYLGDDLDDYLYIYNEITVERWPRAETACS